MDGVDILKIFLILIPVLGVIYVLRLSRSMRLEKRLASFALTSSKDQEISFFDELLVYVWKFIHILTKIFKKSVVLRNYGRRYEKYIAYLDRNKKDGIDYVSIKFFIAFIVFVLGVISLIMHQDSFDSMIWLLIMIISFFLPDIYLAILFNQKRKRIEDDLLRSIIIMNNAFSSGKNIMQAIMMVKTELDGPIQDEFEKIYLDITYGLSLDVVFKRFYERVKIEDVQYITTSLTLLNKTGGDIIRVFSRLEKSILERKNLRSELKSLTSSSRFVFKFLVFLPFIFAAIIFILNPTYFSPLVSSILGIFMFVIILLLYVLYIWIVKKLLEVKL